MAAGRNPWEALGMLEDVAADVNTISLDVGVLVLCVHLLT